MDGRLAMTSGPSSFYYVPREIETTGTGSGSHVPAAPVPIRFIPNPVSHFSMQPRSAYLPESTSPVPLQQQPAIPVPLNTTPGSGSAGTETVKKKRGRPRKYAPEGSMGLALSPISTSAPEGTAPSNSSGPKRIGRPPGTGTKQKLASLGEWVSGSACTGFMPHVIKLSTGGDISSKIMSFAQQGPRAICILSASGAVSRVTLRQPSCSSGTVTYEGRFEILTLSGPCMLTETDNGSQRRNGELSITLSCPDGRVFGGNVAGSLIAASPIQVIVGSFIYAGSKEKTKSKKMTEPTFESDKDTGHHYTHDSDRSDNNTRPI